MVRPPVTVWLRLLDTVLVVVRAIDGEGIGLPARRLPRPPPLFPLLFRFHPPRLGRRCIAVLLLPLPLLLSRIRLDLAARFGRD